MTSSWLGMAVAGGIVLGGVVAAPAVCAQEDEWLRLQAPRFGVISQLEEGSTRRWSVEFDQFIATLQAAFSIDEGALPPLTIVLFENQRAFNPYRPRNEAGEQPDVVGVFGNYGTWSVIGMVATAKRETRTTVYHEAVHWFLSADSTSRPTWFEEGFAETFSTFEIEDGKGRLGMASQGNLDYLQYFGMSPLDEFLRASRDDAHKRNDYYPQAWAFVHYLLFGNKGAQRGKLVELLRLQRETDLDSAFATAFGKSYGDMTNELRTYVRGGRYAIAIVDLADRSDEMTVGAASPASVEFALARLAVIGNNNDLARRHLDAALARAPNAAPIYELQAVLASRDGDDEATTAALDKAIELGSTDATAFASKGFALLEQRANTNARLDDMLDPATARTIADLFNRSIELWGRSRNAYQGLVNALANVDALTERDAASIAIGRTAFPDDGVVLVGQALIERSRGNLAEAARLVRRSRGEPFRMASQQRRAVTGLLEAWFVELVAEAQNGPDAERIAEIETLLDEQLADESLPDASRTRLGRMKLDFRGMLRLNDARSALESGRRADGVAILTEIANDQAGSDFARREAERLLERLTR